VCPPGACLVAELLILPIGCQESLEDPSSHTSDAEFVHRSK
jgi:hypothetical protein